MGMAASRAPAAAQGGIADSGAVETGVSLAWEAPARWPLSSVMPPLGAIPATPGCVRAHLRTVLAAWGLRHLAEDGVAIASELAANAVNASRNEAGQPVCIHDRLPVVRVCLLCDWIILRLEVWDQAPGIPVLRHPAAFEEAGRGLALVEELSQSWGWQPAPFPGTKIVWAELRL